MSVPVITFFNNKGGVGKTSLVFHLAWMLSRRGRRVVAIDLDPQANLTAAFLELEELVALWDTDGSSERGATVYQCVRPLMKVGDILDPQTRRIHSGLHLVPGDLGLASYEDFLSTEWPKALGSEPDELYRPFRLLSAFWQIAQRAAVQSDADVILADVGPNLGAINRSALIATDHVVIPLAADLFSLQGLRDLGPTLRTWRTGWRRRTENWPEPAFALPSGAMKPLGYVLMQHSERLSRPTEAFVNWTKRIPDTYRKSILNDESNPTGEDVLADRHCIARLKHYRSLVPMAQEARKPIFELTPADGAIGNHAYAARDARVEFGALADVLEARALGGTPADPMRPATAAVVRTS